MNCTTSILGPNNTLEQATSSADARFFRPFLLPPEVPASHQPSHGTPVRQGQIHNNPAQLHALGSGPRLGHRTAARYNVDREAWERRAALRV